MFEVTVLNLISNATFVKRFSSPFLAQKYVNKIKRSKKVRVIATSGFF